MPKNFSRTDRIADVTHRIIARMICEDFKDPRIGRVTISDVKVSPDLKYAKVFITVLPESKVEETLKILNDAAGFFRSNLASSLSLRVVPKPHFVYDDSVVKGNRIFAILESERKLDHGKT